MINKNICLVGVGPHCKRIYLNCLNKIPCNLKLVVELESKRKETEDFLKQKGFSSYVIYCIKDERKDLKYLHAEDCENLKRLCLDLNIDSGIICTEPKAHNTYLTFFLNQKIPVLSDKPITVSKNMMRLKNINNIVKDYNKLVDLSNKNNTCCQIMCQRSIHKGYNYVKNLLTNIVKSYNVPITFIEIFHSDGKWMMPHDLPTGENHPYKYGYGKLFHSGYHFIQLLAEFLQINNYIIDETKQITKCESFSTFFTPNDEKTVINYNDYKELFKEQQIPEFYNQKDYNFKNYGEKNNYTLFSFKNKNNRNITVAELNLLQNSFSRRGWINTKPDEYKDNGRIRHEYCNIEVGTLLNIKIHSYQSKEIKDRTNTEFNNGGLEHFDIDIYRNVDIIGGLPYEHICLKDLYEEDENKSLGYNEKSRQEFIYNFLYGKDKVCELQNHKLSICLLHKLCLSLRQYNKKGKTQKQNFKIEGIKNGISKL